MKLKKYLALALIAVLAVCFAACGGSGKTEGTEETTTAEKTDVKIGVRSDLIDYYNAVEPVLEAKGYNVEMVSFDDSIQPNVALGEGSIDINWFQHEPYLTYSLRHMRLCLLCIQQSMRSSRISLTERSSESAMMQQIRTEDSRCSQTTA